MWGGSYDCLSGRCATNQSTFSSILGHPRRSLCSPTKALLHTEFVALLARAGVTQADFARLTGVTARQVNNWARGRAAVPPWAALLAVVLEQSTPEMLLIAADETAFRWHEGSISGQHFRLQFREEWEAAAADAGRFSLQALLHLGVRWGIVGSYSTMAWRRRRSERR